MKSLVRYIQEEMGATPGNTMGAGNPALPGPNGVDLGSGDIITGTDHAPDKKRKKKRKKLKHIENEIE